MDSHGVEKMPYGVAGADGTGGGGGAVLAYIKKLTYKPDLTLGFLEHDGMIFPKVFSVNLSIQIGSDRMGLKK